jgi:hypothetical protein
MVEGNWWLGGIALIRTGGSFSVRTLRVLLLVLLPLAGLSAQEPTVIKPGDRVRLLSPEYLYVATIVDLRADTLLVEPDGYGETVSVALSSLIRIGVHAGRNWLPSTGAGALIGGAIGGVGALVVKVLAEPETDVSTLVLVAGGSGGALGAFVGFVTAGERWRDSGFRPELSRAVTRRSGLGVRLSIPAF